VTCQLGAVIRCLVVRQAEVKPLTKEEVLQIISWNDVERLRTVLLALSLHSDKHHWAHGKCIDLASHEDPIVRGNALRSFGHSARRHGSVHVPLVEPLLQKGLRDPEVYVRRQAEAAADDIDQFCTWKVQRNPKNKRL
jgi:hypothetical protein